MSLYFLSLATDGLHSSLHTVSELMLQNEETAEACLANGFPFYGGTYIFAQRWLVVAVQGETLDEVARSRRAGMLSYSLARVLKHQPSAKTAWCLQTGSQMENQVRHADQTVRYKLQFSFQETHQ